MNRKKGRPKTHKQPFTLRMNKGIHDYVSRQAEDLGITKSAFVENAIYQYVGPKQLHLDHLAVPDIDGRVQSEFQELGE